MREFSAVVVCAAVCLAAVVGCARLDESQTRADAQKLYVYMEWGTNGLVNTFDGTVDVWPDTTIAFAFTPGQQDTLLARAEAFGFFDFPDVMPKDPNRFISGELGPQVLRLKAGERDHTVTWFVPMNQESPHFLGLASLYTLIVRMIESNEEFTSVSDRRLARRKR